MLNVICVNVGNYLGRGDEYVRKLQAGVAAHLDLPYSFHVLTDRDVHGLTGWWAKLAMFEPGRFSERCFFLDLDTIVTGSLDEIAGYAGDFAALSDFYHPQHLASGVMAWRAGACDDIWTRWQDCGAPQFGPGGDGAWIDAVRPDADRLQDLFPRQIVSFKADCMRGTPLDARLVCFHGLPRPHTVADLMRNW